VVPRKVNWRARALCAPTLSSLVRYRSGVDAELLHHEVHDRRLDFATIWKSSVRSEEEQKYREGKAICLALTSDAGVILWSERPWVDRIRKVWRFVVL
jgi:hypothetical protein